MARRRRSAKGRFVRAARSAGRRTRRVTRYVRSRSRGMKLNWRSMIRGALWGTAASVGGYYLGNYSNRPILGEVGQRGGAVLAAKKGGWQGVLGFQLIDAAFDRGIVQRRLGISGLQSGTVNAI